MIAAGSWIKAIGDQPVDGAIAIAVLASLAVGGGIALQHITRRTRSLRHLVLAIAIASLVIGAVAALLLARMMVLDDGEARTVIGVLALTALFAIVLASVASASLGHDAAQVEAALRGLESGDRTARTNVRRRDELGHVARALDELSTRLDQLDRERQRLDDERRVMLASVGHDLRTPLAALRAAIEALQDGIAPDVPRYLRAMAHDVDALSSLVDDLFLLSRIEAGSLDLPRTRIDLREIVDEAAEALGPAAAARRVTIALRCAESVRVDGNARALGRVVRNLLDNAVRHAPEGSTVDVVIEPGPEPVVRVIDQGTGFGRDFSATAFDHFSRADPSRSRTGGGAGLGLAIARGLVEAHGGTIWLEPPPGGIVAFELPVTPSTASGAQ
jgi:signal transduction histidine kinase